MNSTNTMNSIDSVDSMDSQVNQSSPLKSEMMNDDNNDNNDKSKSKKPIPIELTAYGTTPSGKPRLFVCQVCTRAFARLEHLRRHERSHTKEKPFTCGVCQRKFSRRDLLLRHAQKLHAGCADAITRLRRKSVKKIDETSSTPLTTPMNSMNEINEGNDDKKDVEFNLNLFHNNHSINQQLQNFSNQMNENNGQNKQFLHQKRSSTSHLSKQIFDKKRLRGASFSAQSGANYAANIPEFNDLYTGTDNVEFSTPQLMPTSVYDEPSWLNNLSTIPGMTEDLNHHPKSEGDHNVNDKKNLDNNKKLNLFEDLRYMLPTATMNSDLNNKDLGFGYSFYDIPESMMDTTGGNTHKSNNGLTPIKQEFEEDHFNEVTPSKNGGNGRDGEDIFDINLNFINDIGDLTNEIDVNSKFIPNGYSFYGDSVSSSGLENSPNYQSPNVNPNNLNNFLNQSQILNIENNNNVNNLSNLKISNYSKILLFTNNIKTLINKSLNKYPINGSINPIIPSNEKLEYYLNYFKNKFLNHYPFIHPSKLNEYEIMMMTSNEDYSNEASRVCLPLLIATIGALLSNNKNDLEHLYEASRRTIHIYLESRKMNNQSKNNNPLWLIQSLTLSVIYGLFSDNENNVFIVIRQLNALNSLVKTSIKDNRNFQIFNINDLDDMSNEDNDGNAELSKQFKELIDQQSQYRIIFIIYRLTSFLLMFYNIPLTLSVSDLNNLKLPNINDDNIWKCYNFKEYQNLKQESLKSYNFKEILLKISKNSFSDFSNFPELKNFCLFSYDILIHGIFEINQFNNNLNTINILNNLTRLFNHNYNHQYSLAVGANNNVSSNNLLLSSNNYQLIDYSIIVNLVKISSILDFKSLKQQSWLKNYKELIKIFENLINSIKLNEFSRIDKILDYCLVILKFLIVKFEKVGDNNSEIHDDEVNFEKLIGIDFINVLNNDPNLILSQGLFQIFSILAIILVKLLKSPKNQFVDSLNSKFKKIFVFCKFIQINYNLPVIFEAATEVLKFNDIYYLLNIGELLLNHYYSNFLKFSIFEKLSINLYQIRKYLSDNENKLK